MLSLKLFFFRSRVLFHFCCCADCAVQINKSKLGLQFKEFRCDGLLSIIVCGWGKCVNVNSFAAILKCLFEHIEWKKGHSLTQRCKRFQSSLKTIPNRKFIEINWMVEAGRYLIYRPCFLEVNKPYWLANQICLSIFVGSSDLTRRWFYIFMRHLFAFVLRATNFMLVKKLSNSKLKQQIL